MVYIQKIINYAGVQRPKLKTKKEQREWAREHGYCGQCITRRCEPGLRTCATCLDLTAKRKAKANAVR